MQRNFNRPFRIALWMGACTLVMFCAASFAEQPSPAKLEFTRDIRPLFAKHCFKCHGPEEEDGGLRLDVRNRVLDGGTSGPALVAGKSADSLIYQFVTGRNEDKVIMPPKGRGERMGDAECDLVRRWIDQGAAWNEETENGQDSNESRQSVAPALRLKHPANVSSCRRFVSVRGLSGRLRWGDRALATGATALVTIRNSR